MKGVTEADAEEATSADANDAAEVAGRLWWQEAEAAAEGGRMLWRSMCPCLLSSPSRRG